jgi:hypothetical protein
MRVMVLSDTHGELENLKAALSLLGRSVDLVLHLGDGAHDASHIHGIASPPTYAVRGNGDFDQDLPQTLLLPLGRALAWCAHGHRHGAGEASGDSAMAREAKKARAGIVLHGHTHAPRLERKHGLLYCCPGSLSRPRTAAGPSFAVIRCHPKDSLPHIVIYGVYGRELRAIAW